MYKRLLSYLVVRLFRDDPADARIARQISWQKMQGDCFAALAMLVSGTGVLTFKIFAATNAAGADAVEVQAHADPTKADAAGDQLVLEIAGEEVISKLQAAGADLEGKEIHVSVQMDNDAANDINSIAYVFGKLRNPRAAATADIIA